MSLQQMMKKNAIAKVSFRYGSMDALGSSFAHLLGCCNITAEVVKSRDQQGARNHKVNYILLGGVVGCESFLESLYMRVFVHICGINRTHEYCTLFRLGNFEN